MSNVNYSNVLTRVKSATVDALFIMLLIVFVSNVFNSIETLNTNYRIIAFISIFIVYDPLFITFFGATLGHLFFDLRVRRNTNIEKNITLFNAIKRFFLKFTLGWFSLFSISADKKKRAIHDFAANSVVISIKKITFS